MRITVPQGVTVYYISEEGNDENNGLSEERPWRTVVPLNTIRTFGPGTWILFRGGDHFKGGLFITMNGTSQAPCLISSYGNGKAEITDHMIPDLSLILLYDSQYVTVNNLKITGAPGTNYPGPDFKPGNPRSYGLDIRKSDPGSMYFESITVDNVEFRNSYGGLWIGADCCPNQKGYNNVRITNCLFEDVYQWGFRVYGYGVLNGGPVDQFTNVYIGKNVFRNIKGDPNFPSEAQPISVFNTTGTVIERNLLINNCGIGGMSAGTPNGGSAALCVNNVRNFKILYNVITGTTSVTHYDGCAIDVDQDSLNGEVAFNLTYSNNGPSIQWGSFKDRITGNMDIHHNISINDVRGCTPGSQQGTIRPWAWGTGDVENVRVFNNTVYVDGKDIQGTPSCVSFDWKTPKNHLFFNNIFKATGPVRILQTVDVMQIDSSTKFFGNCYDVEDNSLITDTGDAKMVTAYAGLGSLSSFDPAFCLLPEKIEQFALADLPAGSPCISAAIDPWPYAAADVIKKDFHGNTSPIVNIGASNTNK